MEEGNFDINKNYLNIPEPKEGEKVGKHVLLVINPNYIILCFYSHQETIYCKCSKSGKF